MRERLVGSCLSQGYQSESECKAWLEFELAYVEAVERERERGGELDMLKKIEIKIYRYRVMKKVRFRWEDIDKERIFYLYSSEHKIQNDVKKSKYEITFYLKASWNILSRKNKDIKVNYIIPKYKAQKNVFW